MSDNSVSNRNNIQRPIQPRHPIGTTQAFSLISYPDGIPAPTVRLAPIPQPQNATSMIPMLLEDPDALQRFVASVPEHLRTSVIAQVPRMVRVTVTDMEIEAILKQLAPCQGTEAIFCSVCMCDIDAVNVFTTSCRHSFCIPCLVTWILTKLNQNVRFRGDRVDCTCPSCRGVFYTHEF
jgi:hypothetical protein